MLCFLTGKSGPASTFDRLLSSQADRIMLLDMHLPKIDLCLSVQGGLTTMRSTASHSNRPMDRERKQILAETVQNLEESQIEGDFPGST